jgi:hypothetical protein
MSRLLKASNFVRDSISWSSVGKGILELEF